MKALSVISALTDMVQNHNTTDQQLLLDYCSQRCWNRVIGRQHKVEHQRSVEKPIHKVGYGTI